METLILKKLMKEPYQSRFLKQVYSIEPDFSENLNHIYLLIIFFHEGCLFIKYI